MHHGADGVILLARQHTMHPDDLSQRLSQISTQWTEVLNAHAAPEQEVAKQRGQLANRYAGAVFRYVLGAVRDADAAEELCQDFVLRLLQGNFHRASPDRGRFRDYVKSALINLINDYYRSQHDRPLPVSPGVLEPAAADRPTSEQEFADYWREELLEQTWRNLKRDRPNYYATLRARTENPEMSARELAELLSRQQKTQCKPAAIRKTLERARVRFADLLLEEVATSLASSDTNALRAELKELNLLRYCGSALQRREANTA